MLIAGAGIYFTLRSSLPQIDGEITGAGVTASIERDASGVPTIRGATRADLAFATGFAHAQDRFFQMDLMRRASAGRLSALLGATTLDADRKLRPHAFAQVAEQVVANAPREEREIVDAYVAGVNFALERAPARPWEYTLLNTRPEPWTATDTVLVAFTMFLNLNDSTGESDLARAELHDALPPELYAFMHPLGTQWDAPVIGSAWRPAGIPGPEVFDLRSGAAHDAALSVARNDQPLEEAPVVGSNSWAVAGSRTKQGGALLANDMHLALRLPHVWYHARLVVAGADGASARDLVGVTLPGLPVLVVGSNGHVAWGYTNSYGDWTDLVAIDVDPASPDRYLTADGAAPFEVHRETIEVRGSKPVTLEAKVTRWGPIVAKDASGRPLALAWTAHDARATNFHLFAFETAGNVAELLTAANRAGAPVQNVLAADDQGHIGWSVMGQVPIRTNYDSTLVSSWREPNTGWTGWRSPEEYPRVLDPPSGRLWTANARTIDTTHWLEFLGDGGYDLGARAQQIRDDLLALDTATREDMVKIQIDDRALFLTRWRDLLLGLLDERSLAKQPERAEARRLIEAWSAHASPGDAGYRLVRAFRLQVRKDVFAALTATARRKFPEAKFAPSAQFEGALWQLVTVRPAHLLDPRYPRWEDALLASLDTALDELGKDCGRLERCTWGRANTLAMTHPLSAALPFASHWLDMPAEPMAGDASMPRAQGSSFGASERLVVTPGREQEGYFQMPGGPVDHPLSPFYGAGHEAWVRGEPRPLLPDKTAHTLTLRP